MIAVRSGLVFDRWSWPIIQPLVTTRFRRSTASSRRPSGAGPRPAWRPRPADPLSKGGGLATRHGWRGGPARQPVTPLPRKARRRGGQGGEERRVVERLTSLMATRHPRQSTPLRNAERARGRGIPDYGPRTCARSSSNRAWRQGRPRASGAGGMDDPHRQASTPALARIEPPAGWVSQTTHPMEVRLL
jgi:hypothetical protein